MYALSVLIDIGIVFFFYFAWILSYITSDKKTIDIIRSGNQLNKNINSNITEGMFASNEQMFRNTSKLTSYVDYIDKGMYYS